VDTWQLKPQVLRDPVLMVVSIGTPGLPPTVEFFPNPLQNSSLHRSC
jgi:hypothetical protein